MTDTTQPPAETLTYDSMRSGGRCDWRNLREAVSEATRGVREIEDHTDAGMDTGHRMVPSINYNSLDRIVTAFVDAALTRRAGGDAIGQSDGDPDGWLAVKVNAEGGGKYAPYPSATALEARAREILRADAYSRQNILSSEGTRHDEEGRVTIGTAVSAMMTLAREFATLKPPAGGDAGAALEQRKAVNTVLGQLLAPLVPDVVERIRLGNEACTAILAAFALPAPVVEGDARERFKTAMVDAARARGGAGAHFIANGETNLWLDVAYDAFAALSEGRSHG